MDSSGAKLVFHRDIYTDVIEREMLHAGKTVWIATADLKDLHVRLGKGFKPLLEVFEQLAQGGVTFRIIHAKLPSKRFRETFDSLPALRGGALELQVCPRSHWKMVIVDHAFAYFGSANFTGAGLGVKSERRRNLEMGAVTREPAMVDEIVDQFDRFWMGDFCHDCAFNRKCPDPIDPLN